MELNQLRHRLKETISRSSISVKEVDTFVNNVIFSAGGSDVTSTIKKSLRLPLTKQKMKIVLISNEDEEHLNVYVSKGVLRLK
ncbi:hypothetical protein [Streptococcus henryi]|uniref:hypothetical protein n=1 Tax=Streptococcus henryi TaxID=439219 RepID=UPI0003825360|nr:hypothetical protein [Streptococcus henryi]